MSKPDNFDKFTELARTDADLQGKIRAIYKHFAESLTRLSEEAGLPCKPEDFMNSSRELDVKDLESATGGWSYWSWNDSPPK